MFKINKSVFPIALIAVLSAGCSTTPEATVMNSEPGNVAPRLVKDLITWDNPKLFGMVPEEVREEGDNICRQQGFPKAVGYHPKAINEEGEAFENGAFYCARTAATTTDVVSEQPNSISPRLVKNKHPQGVGWDNPSAFGKVPANLQELGNASCVLAGAAKAVGYHPKAIGLDGKPMSKGGYFCSN